MKLLSRRDTFKYGFCTESWEAETATAKLLLEIDILKGCVQ